MTAKRKKALLVDEDDITETIHALLDLHFPDKLEIHRAGNYKDALEVLRQTNFNILISELLLGADIREGLEFLKRAKEEGLLSALCACIIPTEAFDYSAYDQITARAKTILGKNCKFFKKPASIDALADYIGKACKLR